MTLLQHFIRSLIDWVFRRRSPALLIMQIGLACLALAFGAGWASEDGSEVRMKRALNC